MFVQIGYFFLGLIILIAGAEWLVKGSSRLALTLGIRPIVIGLTVVAFGTSSPELVISLGAAFQKSEGIAIGNIIGSNIANIGLVLGMTALVSPIKVERSVFQREIPVMIIVSVIFVLMSLDQEIGFLDGMILFAGLFGYMGYHVYAAKKASNLHAENTSDGTGNKLRIQNTLLAALGLLLLIGGAHLIVQSGVVIAKAVGVNEVVIGLTLVSVGTSLPELATSIAGARRNESDLCIGNVVGSNIFNIMCVIGIVAMVHPLGVDRGLLTFELPVMLLFSFALIPLMKTGLQLSRIGGGIALLSYAVFLAFLF